MKSIEQQITALRQMAVHDLIERYQEEFGKQPRVMNSEWLLKRISWRIQERKYGGLSETAKTKLEQLIAEIDLPIGQNRRTISGKLKRRSQSDAPKSGTVFTRMYKGREIQTVVIEDGRFEYEGDLYQSLSSVARAVTGTHWNGKLFFGLTQRRKK